MVAFLLLTVLAGGAQARDRFSSPRQPGSSAQEFLDDTRIERDQWLRDSRAAHERFMAEIRPYREEWLRRSRELRRQWLFAGPQERKRLQAQSAELMRDYLAQTEEALRRLLSESSALTRRFLDETQPAMDEWLRQAQARYEAMLREFRSRYGGTPSHFPDRQQLYSSLLDLSGRPRSGLVPDQILNTVYAAYGDSRGLTWDGVQKFQSDLVRSTTYRHEPRALRPNEFYATGGGNCVDYSLATAAFLRHHGIESYVGGFFPPGETFGHAVVLIPVESVPHGFAYFELENWTTEDGRRIPDGRYVPIDYEYVGGFSSATAENAKLTRVWHPDHLVAQW